MSETSTKVYCIDSSAFITLNRVYAMGFLPEDIWKLMQDLFDRERIVSHEFVYAEICPKTSKPDFLAKWIKKNSSHFFPVTVRQTQLVTDILAKFSSLINSAKEINEADPWIIALAIEKRESSDLFGRYANLTVVSSENEKSAVKIPAACKEFSIPHLGLKGFFSDNGWKIKLET
jgi:hypothetical protein